MTTRALRDALKWLLDRARWTEPDYERAMDIADKLNEHATRDQIAAHERRLGKIRAKAITNGVGLPAMKDIQLMREAAQEREMGNLKRVDEVWREARRRQWPSDVMRSVFDDDAA